ncbi:MAG: hypothetical protein JNM57_06275 [Cyclobacteriaceae bacterium]|nr:hypothetical protein [Cyclobacteriaceae bacterium]
MKNLLKIIAPLVLVFLGGCYYDQEGILYPEGNCTAPLSPSFNTDILPLLNTRCNNCHSGAYASANIKLDSYAEVIKYVNNGSLMGSINHTGEYSPMPKNSGKMPSCEIQKIQNWITSGSLNN